MNIIGDVDLNAIPDAVLSALSSSLEMGSQNYALDQQNVQHQQHLHGQHQVPQHHSQFAQHPHQQYPQQHHHHMQQQQHHPQHAHLQQHQQQKGMHHIASQQHQQSPTQYYSQNISLSTHQQQFPSMTSYPYQSHVPPPPPSYQSSTMNPLPSPSHSVSNSSADHLPVQNSSLPSMAHQNHPSFSPAHLVHQPSPTSQISSPANPSYNRRQLNRTMSETGVDQSYLNQDQAVNQHQYNTNTRILQSSNVVSQSQNSSNASYFDNISSANRLVANRRNSLNSQQVIPNQQRPYPVGNSLSTSMPQPSNYHADASIAYSQGKSTVNSNSGNNKPAATNAVPLQPRCPSNPMSDGSSAKFPTYIDQPFIHPSPQNKSVSTKNHDGLNSKSHIGSHASIPTTEYFKSGNDTLMKALLAPTSSSQQTNFSPAKTGRVSKYDLAGMQNALMNEAMNGGLAIPDANSNYPSNSSSRPATTASGSYHSRYPSPSVVSRQNISQQSIMATPGVTPSIRPAAPTTRGGMPALVRGSPLSRGSSTRGARTVRGAPGGGPNPNVRGLAPPRGHQPLSRGAPPTRAAPSARGVPATRVPRGQPLRAPAPVVARGALSGRGTSSVRGNPTARGASSSRGMSVSRGASNSTRGGGSGGVKNNRGRGRAQPAVVMETRGAPGTSSTHMELSETEGPVGNPIQWYRMPETVTTPAVVNSTLSGFQSDIEAMRASMNCEIPRLNNDCEKNQRQRTNVEPQRPETRVNTSKVNDNNENGARRISTHTTHSQSSVTNSQTQSSVKVGRIHLKQEIIEGSPQSSNPVSKNESSANSVNKTNVNNVSKRTQSQGLETNISQDMPNQLQDVRNMNRNEISPVNLQPREINSKRNDSTTPDSHSANQVDKKPCESARDRVYSLWRAGQVVGRAAKVKPKPKAPTLLSSSDNPPQMVDQNGKNICVNKDIKGQSEIAQTPVINRDSPRNSDENSGCNNSNDQAKSSEKNLFYVLFHGHKLICLSSGHGNAVLVCQFQYECFADKGKGMVSNCINKALRIKKKILEHPNKEAIISFLKNNGYLKGVLQHEPVHVMSLDDARRVYHFIYNIINCSIATCVVEVLNQSVDLNIVISPSKRKILTQEMKMRIKREKKQVDDERYGRLHPPQTGSRNTDKSGSQFLTPGGRNKSSSSSDRSESTVAYGTGEDGDVGDDSDDVVIVEGPEDPYLLKWDGKQSKPGCVCNTIVGQVRSYHHDGDNYLVVSDLCRILGTSEFMTGIETDNVILYSCTKDILSFLNELSNNFPQLDTGQNCLVREKDVGVHATDGDGDQNPPSEINRITPLKRSLCKQEIIDGDEETVSNPKHPRLSNDAQKGKATPAPSPKKNVNSSLSFSSKVEQHKQTQQNLKITSHSNTTQGTDLSKVKSSCDEDNSNVIIVFDTSSISRDKSLFETVSSSKPKENTKDPKSATSLSSPDSCLSMLSQDGPQSPVVLRQQKDLNPPTQTCDNFLSVDSVNNLTAKSKTITTFVDKTNQDSLEKSSSSQISEVRSSAKSQTDSINNSPTTVFRSEEAKSKRIVATVIDINSLTSVTSNNVSKGSKACDNRTENAAISATPVQSLPTVADTSMAKKTKTQPADQELLLRLSSSKGLPILKTKHVEDDLELSRLHVTSLEGFEQYRSRGSLLKEMEILRFKNKTLQETLKALRDQLKKSKAEQEKSEKLATYYGSVIQEITATFKDGDKVEPATMETTQATQSNQNSGMVNSPICIDDDDD